MKRFIYLCIPVFLLLLIPAVLCYRSWLTARPPFISSTGGKTLEILLPVKNGHFLQLDPRWRNERIGGSGESIDSVGCTLCCLATALRALGEDTDPSRLNQNLIRSGGYTARGWLEWTAITGIFQNRVEAIETRRLSHKDVDHALEQGHFPIVKFRLSTGINHWVLIVGKRGLEYLVLDPLKADPRPVILSSLTPFIYSVRYVCRKFVTPP